MAVVNAQRPARGSGRSARRPKHAVDPGTSDEPKSSTPTEAAYRRRLEAYYQRSPGSAHDQLKNFPKYVPRQHLATFMAKHKIFEQVLGVHGSVVECGVFQGGGLMAFAQLSAILEPVNHQRHIIGFDTFAGFMALAPEDRGGASAHAHQGGLKADSIDDLREAITLFDMNRPLGHMPKVELVPGDICQTAPQYLKDHPHTVVSLLYLDVDVFEPTKAALDAFLPRMPRGAIVAFDELNASPWPGETQALLKTVGIHRLRLRRFPFEPYISYAVLE